MLFSVANLHVSYGNLRAVCGVTLDAAKGSIVTLLGANGAGKTSTLMAIMGLVKSSGDVRFDGENITRWSTKRRVAAGMALVPEGRRILATMTIEENLQMGAYQRGGVGRRGDMDRVYDRFPNLARRRAAPAAVLSGGEQQMLAIGRALMSRPRLLIMDEPSLGLSPLFVREIFSLMADLNAEGLSILLVEQNTRLALRTASRGYVLRFGEVTAEGPSDLLLRTDQVASAYLGDNALRRSA